MSVRDLTGPAASSGTHSLTAHSNLASQWEGSRRRIARSRAASYESFTVSLVSGLASELALQRVSNRVRTALLQAQSLWLEISSRAYDVL